MPIDDVVEVKVDVDPAKLPTRPCRDDEHDLHWYTQDTKGHATSSNEDGWRCCACGWAPGEPPGFSPKHDRELVAIKVFGILMDMHHNGLIYVSNSTAGDGITASVADRCEREGRFDSISIMHAVLDGMVESHARFWREISEGILRGHDPRDRCPCGTLAMSSSLWKGKWIRRCREHTSADFRGDYGGPGAGPQRDLFRVLDEQLAADGWPEVDDAPF